MVLFNGLDSVDGHFSRVSLDLSYHCYRCSQFTAFATKICDHILPICRDCITQFNMSDEYQLAAIAYKETKNADMIWKAFEMWLDVRPGYPIP